MPLNVFGNSSSSHDKGNKIDTPQFVKKTYLRSKYIESDIEENNELKGQYRIKNLKDPFSIRLACSKNYVDDKFNDPSIIKNIDHVDFNDENLVNVRFIKVISIPTLEEQLTPKNLCRSSYI